MVHAEFRSETVDDHDKATGVTTRRDVDFIRVQIPGGDIVDRRATPEDKIRYQGQYEDFQKGEQKSLIDDRGPSPMVGPVSSTPIRAPGSVPYSPSEETRRGANGAVPPEAIPGRGPVTSTGTAQDVVPAQNAGPHLNPSDTPSHGDGGKGAPETAGGDLTASDAARLGANEPVHNDERALTPDEQAELERLEAEEAATLVGTDGYDDAEGLEDVGPSDGSDESKAGKKSKKHKK